MREVSDDEQQGCIPSSKHRNSIQVKGDIPLSANTWHRTNSKSGVIPVAPSRQLTWQWRHL